MNGYMTLSPEVQRLIRSETRLSASTGTLMALNAKAARTGSPVFVGISAAEKARRRAAGRVAKASRKANR